MPLTKRQFQLGIDQEIENWMRQIYGFLAEDREHAYSGEELFKKVVGERWHSALQAKLDQALTVLVGIGTVELREVVGIPYYKFYHEADQTTWELKIRV